jgi:hypothetical protein
MTTTTFERGFFEAMAEKKLSKMRPAEMLQGLKRYGLRTRLGGTKIPLESTIYGYGDMSARQVIVALRRQVRDLTLRMHHHVRRRVKYFWQCQMVPYETRRRMANYLAMTIMPGNGLLTFPRATKFWDIERLEFLTLSTRLSRPVVRTGCDPFNVDHFDVRLNVCEIAPEFKAIYLGGAGIDANGSPFSRCILSRSATFEPGCDPLAIPLERPDVIDNMIALHEHLEISLVDHMTEQTTPRFPDVWLGFPEDVEIRMEVTDGLKQYAYQRVREWLMRGQPLNENQPEFKCLPPERLARLAEVDPCSLSGWDALEKHLGAEAAGIVLADTWSGCRRRHEGVLVLPAIFFNYDSEQKLWEKATRFLVDIEPYLGQQIITPDGRDDLDMSHSSIQIIRLGVPEVPPHGRIGYWHYDFSETEIGFEEYFK